MNNKGLSCSTVILLITITFQGCSHLSNQVAKVKSALPTQKNSDKLILAARTFESKNELLAAREQYEKYLSKNPKSAKACHRLGIVCTRLGDPVAATRYFTQARQIDPQNSVLLNDFGYALYQRGQFKAAEKIFKEALQNDANNNRIINNLALSVGHQGRFKESFSLFRNIMPAAEAHANVAYIHTQRGEGELALKEYDLALTADPNLRTAGLAAAELAEMKSLFLAKQDKKTTQQLATRKIAPKAELNKQPTQLVSSKRPVQKMPTLLTSQSKQTGKQKLIAQTSMKRQAKVEPSLKPDTKSEPKMEEDELEINSFRTLDELSEEESVIIRISDEKTQEENLFRTPQELQNN